MKKKLSVLTFNIWSLRIGLIPLASDIKKRIELIPDVLSQEDVDLILLQEVWPKKEKEFLLESLFKKGYSYIFFSDDVSYTLNDKSTLKLLPTFGNGLFVASKYPIRKTENVLLYSGHTFINEKFARKGAIHIVVELENGIEVDVYNTHMNAIYHQLEKSTKGTYQRKIVENQVFELGNFIKQTAKSNNIIVGGDFNLPEDAWNENEVPGIFLKEHGLTDSYRSHFDCHLKYPGYTFCHTNPYTFIKNKGSRLDYIFHKSDVLKLQSSQLRKFLQPTNSLKALSDHYAVLSHYKY